MVGIDGETSNQLFETLHEWEDELKRCSIYQNFDDDDDFDDDEPDELTQRSTKPSKTMGGPS